MSLNAQPAASLFVGGRFVEGEGAALPVLYPYSGEEIASLREASADQVSTACRIAAEAQTAWGALAPVERGRVLLRAAAIIRERNAELSRLETLDTGKPIQETLVADWESGAQALEYFGGLAARWDRTGPTRGASRWVFARGSGHGTIPARSPAGRRRPRW